MKKLRFLMVGSGWRSLFFVRIAKALPERFEMCAMLCRTIEKAERMASEYEIRTSISVEECKEMNPDFVVVAVDKASIYEVSRFWMEAGFPVLSETPPAMDTMQLNELWRLCSEDGCKLQVAEQYLHYPTIASRYSLVKSGILGDPSMIRLSMAHDYHGISLIRHFLGTGQEPVRIWGKTYPSRTVDTDSRYGPVENGEVVEKALDRLTFEFASGKIGFYDFCAIQYHSFLRSRHINVQGEQGELDDFTVRYLNKERKPVKDVIDIDCRDSEFDGTDGCTGGYIDKVWLGNHTLYQNPFPGTGFSEDETAIAVLLDGMEAFLESGKEVYPLSDALQDAYLSILMAKALEQPGIAVESEPQAWNR